MGMGALALVVVGTAQQVIAQGVDPHCPVLQRPAAVAVLADCIRAYAGNAVVLGRCGQALGNLARLRGPMELPRAGPVPPPRPFRPRVQPLRVPVPGPLAGAVRQLGGAVLACRGRVLCGGSRLGDAVGAGQGLDFGEGSGRLGRRGRHPRRTL